MVREANPGYSEVSPRRAGLPLLNERNEPCTTGFPPPRATPGLEGTVMPI